LFESDHEGWLPSHTDSRGESPTHERTRRIGWIGTGRTGFALCNRLLDSGVDLAVHNRTVAKTAPLAERGATVVEAPIDLADRDIVFHHDGRPCRCAGRHDR
jgi:phosphoglycerate dehydrogenase-like enzyme